MFVDMLSMYVVIFVGVSTYACAVTDREIDEFANVTHRNKMNGDIA
jgi:hypothetical protein